MNQKQAPPTFFQLIDRMIFHSGWSRLLIVEGTDVLRVRRITPHDFTETDVVGLYSKKDFELGKFTMGLIKSDCREFLNKHGLIR